MKASKSSAPAGARPGCAASARAPFKQAAVAATRRGLGVRAGMPQAAAALNASGRVNAAIVALRRVGAAPLLPHRRRCVAARYKAGGGGQQLVEHQGVDEEQEYIRLPLDATEVSVGF